MKLLRPGDDFAKLDPALHILGAFSIAVALIIGCAILLMVANWSPGEQEQISAAYKAQQHGAVMVADKPSIEIIP